MAHRRDAECDPLQSPPDRVADSHAGSCARTGCKSAGEYRASKDRNLDEYYLFCLEHVRAYNANWDFHADLTPAEIEAEIHNTVTWGRPTGKIGVSYPQFYQTRTQIRDLFGLGAGTDFDRAANKKAYDARPRGGRTAADNAALQALDLTTSLTLDALRGRYKTLVKWHHPDVNGSSLDAERRMKAINAAYRTLWAALVAAP